MENLEILIPVLFFIFWLFGGAAKKRSQQRRRSRTRAPQAPKTAQVSSRVGGRQAAGGASQVSRAQAGRGSAPKPSADAQDQLLRELEAIFGRKEPAPEPRPPRPPSPVRVERPPRTAPRQQPEEVEAPPPPATPQEVPPVTYRPPAHPTRKEPLPKTARRSRFRLSGSSLRDAIVWREILGPPKGLE